MTITTLMTLTTKWTGVDKSGRLGLFFKLLL